MDGHPDSCPLSAISVHVFDSLREGSPPRALRTSRRERTMTMATSKKDASKAGKLLQNPKTPKTVKSVAGSDLAQSKWRPKK